MSSALEEVGMMKHVAALIFLLPVFFVACSSGKNGEGASVAVTTYSPTKPQVSLEGRYEVVSGATQADGVVSKYDSSLKWLSVHGKIKVQPVDNSTPFVVELDADGQVDSSGFVVLNVGKKQSSLPSGVKVGAKATCLSSERACHDSFIDIYIQYHGKVYHHQLNVYEAPVMKLPKDKIVPEKSENKVKDKKPSEPVKKSQEPEEIEDNTEEPEGKTTKGRYIGDIQGDIEKVLENNSSNSVPKAGTSQALVQVIGSPMSGRLENASNLLALEKAHSSVGFHIVNSVRESYFGSAELIYLLAEMGKYSQKMVGNYVLPVGDLSLKNGGKLGRHESHQSGVDADVGFYLRDVKLQGGLFSALKAKKEEGPAASWMMEDQWKLFKFVVSTKYVDRIFIHPLLKKALCEFAIKEGEIKPNQNEGLAYETLRRLRPEKNHYDHFHIRVKCSTVQKRCFQMADPEPTTGCFK